MKKAILIIVLCFVFVFLSACSSTEMKTVENVPDVSRMRIVEYGTNLYIFYDIYTNVMYVYNYRGGVSPIYNADGSLYLYGTPKSVG